MTSSSCPSTTTACAPTAALRPDWTYGLLNAVAIGDLTRLDVDFLALTAKATTVPMIRRTHRRGMKIYPWTINDPVQMSVMMSRGADGIITDRVALANRVKELRARSDTGRPIHHLDRRRDRIVAGDGTEFVRGRRITARSSRLSLLKIRNRADEEFSDRRGGSFTARPSDAAMSDGGGGP